MVHPNELVVSIRVSAYDTEHMKGNRRRTACLNFILASSYREVEYLVGRRACVRRKGIRSGAGGSKSRMGNLGQP